MDVMVTLGVGPDGPVARHLAMGCTSGFDPSQQRYAELNDNLVSLKYYLIGDIIIIKSSILCIVFQYLHVLPCKVSTLKHINIYVIFFENYSTL